MVSESKVTMPSLSQSRYEDMACESLYAARHIARMSQADSEAARRGAAIHSIVASYIDHLAKTRQRTDYDYLDKLAENAPLDVLEVIERVRESYQFDPEAVLGTEMRIAISEDFGVCEENEPATYQGTLDLVLMLSPTEAEIRDGKSYYQIIPADTFQSKFYPLLLMCAIPSIEKVRFVLDFWRYAAERDVTYTREDLPKLKRMAEAARRRQAQIHVTHGDGAAAHASPGRHCVWCPLLAGGCPLEATNPYANRTPEETLRFAVWLKEALKAAKTELKNRMVEGGPIRCHDDNLIEYTAEFVTQTQRGYPLNLGSSAIAAWMKDHPEDTEFTQRLTISGLSSPLKDKKRAALKAAMEEIAEESVITKIRIGKAGDKEEGNGIEG